VKSPFHAAAMALAVAVGTQYTIIDEQGHAVGSLVTAPAQPDTRPDRTFHPDYSRALTVDQMSRAWQAEADRIAPPFVTGGG
jgi:hypothetical protein